MSQKISFLPERFREAMIAANMTQAELADKVGVSVSTIRRYMAGAPIIQRSVRVEIPYVLNVSIGWLVGRSDSRERSYAEKHLDKLGEVGAPLRRDEQLLELAFALTELPEHEKIELARLLGTPEELYYTEAKRCKVKRQP